MRAYLVQQLATDWMSGPRIPVGGRNFPHPSRPPLEPHAAACTIGTESLPRGVKRPGLGVDHPFSSSAEFKERVEVYLSAPSGPSWPV